LNFGLEASRILRIAHMNKDEISGKVDPVVGKVKQGVGEAIGNQKVANQGVIDQAKGAAKKLGVVQRTPQTSCVSPKGKPPRRRPIAFATISASRWKMPRRRLKRRSTNLKTVTLDKSDNSSQKDPSKRPGTLPGLFSIAARS
jgi:uncharacterized protein YjbJ (UPF0337 family)